MNLISAVRNRIWHWRKPSLRPGPTTFADGKAPADPALRRLPLVVWGDAFFNGDRPQLRRTLAGGDAHECMYAWVYLNELVTVREMLDAAARESFAPPASAGELRGRFESLRSATTDPQSQISLEWPDVFLPAAMFFAAAGEEKSEYCELGSTFFVSIEKLDLCGRILGMPLDRSKLRFSGVEYSPFLQRASKNFHSHDPIFLTTDAAEWQPTRAQAFQVSRFVGSYAFRSTDAFADVLGRCQAFNLIDAFNLGEADFHSWDLGLPITFLSLPAMINRLSDMGFELFITKVEPEYHAAAARKAMVVRLFGIRRSTADQLDYFERFRPLGGFTELFEARSVARDGGEAIVDEVERSLSPKQWAAFAEYKKYFPIWGGPPGHTMEEVRKLVSAADLGIDLVFDDGQTAHVVRNVIRSGLWSPK